MSEWWAALSGIERFFYYIAFPSTLVLILQFVLSLLGLGGDSDADFDVDADGDFDLDGDFDPEFDSDLDPDADFEIDSVDFKFVTFRGIIAFLTIFGWVGATLSAGETNIYLTLFISTICGLFAMAIVGAIFYFVARLQANGTINYRNSLGQLGEVYIPIPPKGLGYGKIQLVIQERLVEVEAISSNEEAHKTGEIVRVIDVFNTTTLVVEKE